MEFTFAKTCDLVELMSLYRAVTRHMEAQRIPQWDEIYPSVEVIRQDIERGQMRLGCVEGTIALAYSLEPCTRGEYEPADWRYDVQQFFVLHRLCVHPSFQGKGLARLAMDHLEEEARSLGIYAIRLDAFSQKLYESRGYEKAGEITYRKGLFYLYEKDLTKAR
jgi:GNAT superfamily N-acetyltransferase